MLGSLTLFESEIDAKEYPIPTPAPIPHLADATFLVSMKELNVNPLKFQ